jgi:hypothetical protein
MNFPFITWKNAILDGYCQIFDTLVQHLWRQLLLGQAPIDPGSPLQSENKVTYTVESCSFIIFEHIHYKMLAGRKML